MIVDDDPQMLTAIQNLIEPWIRLTALEEPRQFWDVLTEFSPDLLILDVEMPYINGIELCQVVRKDPGWSKLPVIFLTAHPDGDTVERLFAAGADDYASKPIVGPKLTARILTCLERLGLHLVKTGNRVLGFLVGGRYLRLTVARFYRVK